MCSKQNRRLKSKHVHHNYRNKLIENKKKHISCECKCKFNGRKCNSNQKWNNDKCQFEWKFQEYIVCAKKNYICDPATCSCVNGKYLLAIQWLRVKL